MPQTIQLLSLASLLDYAQKGENIAQNINSKYKSIDISISEILQLKEAFKCI